MQIVGNFFDMDIDDDCIPFNKEKIFSKMSWVKKRPTHFYNNKTLAREHLFGYNRVTTLEVVMHVEKYFSLLLNIAR